MKKEKIELEVRKTMKEKFNIEIPKDCWIFPIKKAEEYETLVEGIKEFSSTGNFNNIYVVVKDSGEWGFLDTGKGIYVEPMCYDLSVKDKYVIMNSCSPKHEDGSTSYFSHCAYNTTEGKFSIDLKTTKEISKQGAKLEKELFEDDNEYGGIGEQANGSGYQTISVNEKMGLISKDTLTMFIEPQYDVLMLAWGDVEEFCNQLTKKDQIYCVVKNNGKFGIVNLSNKIVLPIDFGSFDELESYCQKQIAQVGV